MPLDREPPMNEDRVVDIITSSDESTPPCSPERKKPKKMSRSPSKGRVFKGLTELTHYQTVYEDGFDTDLDLTPPRARAIMVELVEDADVKTASALTTPTRRNLFADSIPGALKEAANPARFCGRLLFTGRDELSQPMQGLVDGSSGEMTIQWAEQAAQAPQSGNRFTFYGEPDDGYVVCDEPVADASRVPPQARGFEGRQWAKRAPHGSFFSPRRSSNDDATAFTVKPVKRFFEGATHADAGKRDRDPGLSRQESLSPPTCFMS